MSSTIFLKQIKYRVIRMCNGVFIYRGLFVRLYFVHCSVRFWASTFGLWGWSWGVELENVQWGYQPTTPLVEASIQKLVI